jgi:hypothetical protein
MVLENAVIPHSQNRHQIAFALANNGLTPFSIKVTGSHCLYAYGFRFSFTPLTGVLFAFPSRYWFTIGR